MVFTSEQDAFILMAHFRSGTRNPDGTWSYSLQSCIEQFSEAFPDVNIKYDAFKKHRLRLIARYENKHCICKGKSTGRPTVLTEEVVNDIQQRIQQKQGILLFRSAYRKNLHSRDHAPVDDNGVVPHLAGKSILGEVGR
ncbi:hypothetical protein RI129_004564 [Pyrocoelia pectoralis]|uniref:Uncharacterized protein n=1 Tax=Pyrocoelia pectoralis TaxID=417401 RepID=A0AAN7ZGV2_9COLE